MLRAESTHRGLPAGIAPYSTRGVQTLNFPMSNHIVARVFIYVVEFGAIKGGKAEGFFF